MGYLFLIIALMAGTLKTYCGKNISKDVSTLKGTFYINMLRMLFCAVIGFLVVAVADVSSLRIDGATLLICIVSAISTALFVVTWIICVRNGVLVVVSVFTMAGMILTILLCNIFFGEEITLPQCMGVLLLMTSTVTLYLFGDGRKRNIGIANLVILILCGVFNGLTDFSQKWFIHRSPSGSVGVFNFYTYLFALVILAICFLVAGKSDGAGNDGKSLKTLAVVGVMATSLFAYSYFKTLAARTVSAGILYPLLSGAGCVMSTLMAAICFKEKITLKTVVGIVLTVAAIIVIRL